MTYKELKEEIEQALINKPSWSRNGQFVFNYIDEKYNVAREAQFVHHIDCFYVDDYIDSFIAKCAEILTENEI
jgi:hypothetical protein